MAETEPGRSLQFWATLFVGCIAYTVAIVVWGVRQEGHINEAINKNVEQEQRISQLDLSGSRQVILLDQRLKILEQEVGSRLVVLAQLLEKTNSVNPVVQAQIDNIKSNVQDLKDQQRRIIEALDNTYNKVVAVEQKLLLHDKDK